MTATSSPPDAGARSPDGAEATTTGNYFVSNYPPYGFWTKEAAPLAVEATRRGPRPGVDLGVYVHIPFCRKRCHFCYYRVYTDKKSDEVTGYVDAALAEHARYADSACIGGRLPRAVYFGGGTPSYLSVEQIERLASGMKDRLPWDAVEEVTFECEPGTVTERKIEAIKRVGVTRLSIGVEHFDEEILALNNRAHQGKQIHTAYAHARGQGFAQINIDLIAGMVGETDEKWRACVASAVAMAPDSVTVYQMEVPYNTTIAKEMKASGAAVAPVADWPTKRRWVAEAFAAFEHAGYTVTSTTTAVRDPQRTRFVYRDMLFRGHDLLGVGVASFGHVNGVHVQNEHDFAPYLERVRRGELPILRAYAPDPEELLVREFALLLKYGEVDAAAVARRHGIDPLARFAPQLDDLRARGLATVDGSTVRLTRDALLQVDRLIHAFFLPRHVGGRYA